MYNVQCTILNENPATKNNNKIESKLQEYHKRQTTDSSREFLKIENEQLNPAQNNS